jgi:DNA gyrase subunit A
MEVGLIRKIDIDGEMQSAYLSYAMSVIASRALPDARDGLKPVQRRILFAMHDMNLRADSAYKKSARIVGEVLGKYHPHGDASVYEAMARMAQDFSMRALLVDGQGNFGSVDGDAPAAMRYTEARLAPIAMDLMADIEKDTVDFSPNFDDTLTEPSVLPATVPNLLINGASGIAVGMATSIPPHNLGEVCDALIFMLDQWAKLDDVTVESLMRFIKGPDFPTGGVILKGQDDAEGLAAAYGSGRGRIAVQAKAHIEDMGRGRSRIIVTELPYQVNKASLIERIAELARDGALEGLADLRDESDRQGMRIVIELQRTAEPDKLLHALFKRTPMQGTFSIINLALVNGEPRFLTLKQTLKVFVDHRLEVVRRRSLYDLARAKERAHILEGLLVALKNLDQVIRLIRSSKDTDEARAKLMKHFKLSEAQATAILDMPLRRLAALERKKIEDEYKEKLALIKFLEGLLGSPKKMREVIQEELRQIKQKYADKRRTQIVERGEGETQALLTTADLTPEHNVWATVMQSGLISRTPPDKTPKFSGEAAPLAVAQATSRDILYLVTLKGRAVSVPVHSLPEKEDPQDGAPWQSVSALDGNARVVAAVAVSRRMLELAEAAADATEGAAPTGGCYLFLGTAGGMVKKISVADLPGPTAQVFNVMNVAEDDGIVSARITTGADEVLLVTAGGRAIRFKEEEVRAMGLSAQGVMGIKPGAADDRVIGLEVVVPTTDVMLVTDGGMSKRTDVKEFPTQGRYGVGVVATGLAAKQRLVGVGVGTAADKFVLVSDKGSARLLKYEVIGRKRRASRGAGGLPLKTNESVARLVPWLAQVALPEPEIPPEPAKPVAKKEKAPAPATKQKAVQLSLTEEKPARPAAKQPAAKPPAKPAAKPKRKK